MQKQTMRQQRLFVVSCAAVVLVATGCRSGMPKWNMFAGRSTPSAETLAGNGPSVTYPPPPSESASPMAIASNAAGTTGAGTSSSPTSYGKPGAATGLANLSGGAGNGFDVAKASATQTVASAADINRAAAQANGYGGTPSYNLASGRTSAGQASLPGYAMPGSGSNTSQNSAVPAIPTGYQFGTKATSPAASSNSGSSYSLPTGTPPAGETNSNSYTLPANMPMPSSASQSTSSSVGGFSIPTSMDLPGAGDMRDGAAAMKDSIGQQASQAANTAVNALPFTPKSNSPSGGLSLPGGDLPPASMTGTPARTASTGKQAASFSTASATLLPQSSTMNSPSGSYSPGSTSGASSYPTTSGYPTPGTDGSFYR